MPSISERMAPIVTNTTNISNRLQLAVSDRHPSHEAPVPLIDNPRPEASQAP